METLVDRFTNGNFESIAGEYTDLLLKADKAGAQNIVNLLNTAGADVKALYLELFQRSQRLVGELWQAGKISVAEEHYCTAATQIIMSSLQSQIMSAPRIGRRVVTCCVGMELHEIGIRMVSDFFEMAGWDSYFLGANTPENEIIETLSRQNADVLGISTSMFFNLPKVADLIESIKNTVHLTSVKILVGGYPFIHNEPLWKDMGADGFGMHAEDAVTVANSFFDANIPVAGG